MKQTDRLALLDWEKYKEDIARATPVDRNMTAAEREKHREYLEKHPIEWIKFFFPNYAKYEFADFQKKAIRRIIAHDEWFEVLSWSRELAKSTVTMFIVMNLTLKMCIRDSVCIFSTVVLFLLLAQPAKHRTVIMMAATVGSVNGLAQSRH